MFKKEEKFVIEDPDTHIIIREADPGDPRGVYKLLIHFACMEKSSKRWSKAVREGDLSNNEWAKSVKAEKYRNVCANTELTYKITNRLISSVTHRW
jgi:hypothetical protein